MYPIDDTTAAASNPAPPTDNIGAPGFFQGGVPALAQVPTRVRYWWLNCVQGALLGLLDSAGLAYSKTDYTLVPQSVAIIGRRAASFSQTGSFVVPTGVYRVRVRLWGAGGCGAGSTSSSYPGGGGGGGGYAEGCYAVTPGSVIPVTVPLGATAGQAGGTASFGALISATGGGVGILGSASGVGNGGMGGIGVGGTVLNIEGSPGTTGINLSGTNTGSVEGGMGGTAAFAPGPTRAVGASSVGFNANNGAVPGGGSTGCIGSTATSGQGIVIVEF